MDSCVFCKIIKGELPSQRVFESERIIAIMDIQPVNSGHVLIIPKDHQQSMNDLHSDYLQELMIVAQKVGRAYKKTKIKCEGYNLFLANGEAAFQEVPHVHLHIFPRYKKDGFGLKFSDSYAKKPPISDLETIANEIKEFI